VAVGSLIPTPAAPTGAVASTRPGRAPQVPCLHRRLLGSWGASPCQAVPPLKGSLEAGGVKRQHGVAVASSVKPCSGTLFPENES